MASRGTHVCPWWLAYTFDNSLRGLLHDPAAMFGPWVRPGDTAIDIGCGLGYFSLGLARLVGEAGRVVAVDLQEQMLQRLRPRAVRAGLDRVIRTQRCRAESLGLAETADFALAFWMVHEVPDPEGFFREVASVLRPGGHLYVAEPWFHVGTAAFLDELAAAERSGLILRDRPRVRWSRAAVLERPRESGVKGPS